MKVEKQVKKEARKVKKKASGFFGEFKAFIAHGNVFDLAVGVIIGAAIKDLVNGVVNDILTPIINCIGSAKGDDAIKQMSIPLGSSGQYIMIGDVISQIISFLIMALVVFLLMRSIRKISTFSFKKKKAVRPTVKTCPYCKTEIHIDATRCPHCTSILEEQNELKDDEIK